MSDDDLTDSIESSIGKLSTVIDSIDNRSYDVKHTNFEITKAIKKLNEEMTNFENKDMKENFTDVMSSDKGFISIIVFVLIGLTIYYFMFHKNKIN